MHHSKIFSVELTLLAWISTLNISTVSNQHLIIEHLARIDTVQWRFIWCSEMLTDMALGQEFHTLSKHESNSSGLLILMQLLSDVRHRISSRWCWKIIKQEFSNHYLDLLAYKSHCYCCAGISCYGCNYKAACNSTLNVYKTRSAVCVHQMNADPWINLHHWRGWHRLKPAILFNTPSSEKLEKLHASSSEIRKPVEVLWPVQLFVNESRKHPQTDGVSWCHSEQWNVELLMGKTVVTISHAHDHNILLHK